MWKCKQCGLEIDKELPLPVSCSCGYLDTGNQKTVSTGQKILNFGTAVVKHVAGGMRQVPDEVYENRLSICSGCDKYNSEDSSCTECGCFLKIKCGWATEKCPLGKWDVYSISVKSGCGGCGGNKIG